VVVVLGGRRGVLTGRGGQVGQQRLGHRRIPTIGGADLGGGDDLGVGIGGDVALVAVIAARAGLVAVAGLRVDQRQHPIRGDALGDDEAAVGGLLDILADHGRQQLGRLGGVWAELDAAQGVQRPVAIPEQRVHQLLAGGLIVPVADRLAGLLVVVVTQQRRRHRRGDSTGSARSSPRIPPRTKVTVSQVATASNKGAESSTRRTPTSPTRRASSVVTRKIRSGSAEARSRARSSTSTVCTNPGISSSTPAAYRQRRS